jgi:hypothetical protein
MLSLTLANQELKDAIEQLTRHPWANDQADTIDYIDHLLSILPFREQASAVTSVPQTTANKLSLLRHRLTYILDNEKSLRLDKTACDAIFNIQLALARAYPFNAEYENEEEEEEEQQEAWSDPFSSGKLTRDMEDVVILSNTPALSKAMAEQRYDPNKGSSSGYDKHNHPKDMNNVLLSAREIKSLIKQGIAINVNARKTSKTLGGSIGLFIGNCISGVFFTALIFLAVLAPMIFFAAALTTGIKICHYLITTGIMTAFTASIVLSAAMMILPVSTILLTSATVEPLRYVLNLMNRVIWSPFHNLCRDIGERIESGLSNVFQFIKRKLGLELATPTPTRNSQSEILATLQSPLERLKANFAAPKKVAEEALSIDITQRVDPQPPTLIACMSEATYGEQRAQHTRRHP